MQELPKIPNTYLGNLENIKNKQAKKKKRKRKEEETFCIQETTIGGQALCC